MSESESESEKFLNLTKFLFESEENWMVNLDSRREKEIH